MAVKLYMDVHLPISITRSLRRKGFDILTAQDDDTTRLSDPDLLDRAAFLKQILFTRDADFLREVAFRRWLGQSHMTVIYAHQFELIGTCVCDLEIILASATQEDCHDNLLRIPL